MLLLQKSQIKVAANDSCHALQTFYGVSLTQILLF